MRNVFMTHEQRALDMETRHYQAARPVERPSGGWLRKVRKAMGYAAADMAADLEVSPSMVFQLERSERKETITLKRLNEMAWSMECELVYCIVPRSGNFEDQFMVHAKQIAFGRRARRRKKG
jgi:predicted DNA-binding mobile mystery protein A